MNPNDVENELNLVANTPSKAVYLGAEIPRRCVWKADKGLTEADLAGYDEDTIALAVAFDVRPEVVTNGTQNLVVFNDAGGTGGADPMIVPPGTIPGKVNVPTRENYLFGGYYGEEGGVEVQYFDANGDPVEAVWSENADPGVKQLQAKWIWNPVTVIYLSNGGKGSMGGTKFTAGSFVTLRANAFSRTGYSFAGWALSPAGAVVYGNNWNGQPANAAGKAPVAGETVSLYAVWKASSYTVKFSANGGRLPKGKTMAAQKLTYGKAAKLSKNAFAKTGFVFAGWATSAANAKKGLIAYANGQTVSNLRSDGKTTVLYAVWAKKSYAVAFYANGGTGEMAKETFTYGKAKKLLANKFKAPKGKKFAGWATSKARAKKGLVTYKNKQSVKNLVLTGKTVKLYAAWKRK